MTPEIKKAVAEYQCLGCTCGSDPDCYEKGNNFECGKHVAGTIMMPIGTIYLGMPKGFNRQGPTNLIDFNIFPLLSDGWNYDIYNVPTWKYLDKNGNTLVRGMSPRVNKTFIHIFLENCINGINCLEITEADLSEMD